VRSILWLLHMLVDPDMMTLWFFLVWYPETRVKASPETGEIDERSELKEKVDCSPFRMGNTKLFLGSRT
jgi:hypothetical protein